MTPLFWNVVRPACRSCRSGVSNRWVSTVQSSVASRSSSSLPDQQQRSLSRRHSAYKLAKAVVTCVEENDNHEQALELASKSHIALNQQHAQDVLLPKLALIRKLCAPSSGDVKLTRLRHRNRRHNFGGRRPDLKQRDASLVLQTLDDLFTHSAETTSPVPVFLYADVMNLMSDVTISSSLHSSSTNTPSHGNSTLSLASIVASKLYINMRMRNLEPSVGVHTAYVAAHFASGNLPKALQHIRKFPTLARHPKIVCTLLDGCVSEHDLSRVLTTIRRADASRTRQPAGESQELHTLCLHLGDNKGYSRHLAESECVQHSLLLANLRTGSLSEPISSLLGHDLLAPFLRSPRSLTVLVSSAAKTGGLDAAWALWDRWSQSHGDHSVTKLRRRAFTTLLHSTAMSGDVSRVLDSITNHPCGQRLRASTCDHLLALAHAQTGSIPNMWNVLDGGGAGDMSLDKILSSSKSTKANRGEVSHEVDIEEKGHHKGRLPRHVFHIVIGHLAKEGHHRQAFLCWRLMRAAGHATNNSTISSLLDGLVDRMPELKCVAEGLARMASAKMIVPDDAVFQCLEDHIPSLIWPDRQAETKPGSSLATEGEAMEALNELREFVRGLK